MTIKMIPVGHKILIKPDEVEKEHDCGVDKDGNHIKLALALDEKLAEHGVENGTIVAIGPTAWKAYRILDDNGKEINGPPWAEVGDRVKFTSQAGRFILHPETKEKYKVINDEDIKVILKEVEDE